MMNEPVPDGPNRGMVTDRAMLENLLDQYYTAHGWDLDTSIPRQEILKYLGLDEVCVGIPTIP